MENRWVFSFDLNWATDVHWQTETGRLFHSLGPAIEKARLPNFRFVRTTAKSPHVDDRSPLDLEAEHGVTMDDMCEGEVTEWISYVKREIFNAIRAWVGCQCSCFSIGVMWSLGTEIFY